MAFMGLVNYNWSIMPLKVRTDFNLVSLIIPVYNAEATVGQCLTSVVGLSYPKDRLEVIVVDNGSTDRSVEIAKQYNFTLLHEKKRSSYAARNKGIEHAKGEIIAFTDADCIVTQEWLNNLIEGYDNNKYGCFAGEILSYEPETFAEKISGWAGLISQSHSINSSYLPYAQTANVAYRRDVLDKAGHFNPELISGGDADMSWRMQKLTDYIIRYNPEAIVYHKHRTTVFGLYRQLSRHEYGKLLLKKNYPISTISENSRDKKEPSAVFKKVSTVSSKKTKSLFNLETGMNVFYSLFFYSIKTCAKISTRIKILIKSR